MNRNEFLFRKIDEITSHYPGITPDGAFGLAEKLTLKCEATGIAPWLSAQEEAPNLRSGFLTIEKHEEKIDALRKAHTDKMDALHGAAVAPTGSGGPKDLPVTRMAPEPSLAEKICNARVGDIVLARIFKRDESDSQMTLAIGADGSCSWLFNSDILDIIPATLEVKQ